MSEKTLSRRLAGKLAPHLDSWHRVENSVQVGTPDVWYGIAGQGGWIELKYVRDYPKRLSTPIRFHRFTVEQVATIEEMGKACGRCWLLCQVGLDHYIFSWDRVREIWHEQPRNVWEDSCRGVWQGKLNYEQLAEILRSG